MLSRRDRDAIVKKIGEAIDSLVTDLYSSNDGAASTIQEPEISSRLCQRLEDKLDGEKAGQYSLRVSAQSMPDRGPRSIEKISGADIYMSVSLEGPDGFDKGIFLQAKYDRNLDPSELRDSIRRMKSHVGAEGSYVWVYTPSGLKVLSAHQVEQMRSGDIEQVYTRSATGFAGRILDCYAGTRAWGISPGVQRRKVMGERLRELRVMQGIDFELIR